jgi:hypothetical protein
VALEARPQVMYNLTVDVAHTFFVGNGRWLVHNQCNIPQLTGSLPKELVPQAVGHAKAFTGSAAQKADFLEALYTQVSQKSETLWRYTRYDLSDGSHVFEGPGGFVTAISPDGKLWRGNPDDYAFDNLSRTLSYDRLHPLD